VSEPHCGLSVAEREELSRGAARGRFAAADIDSVGPGAVHHLARGHLESRPHRYRRAGREDVCEPRPAAQALEAGSPSTLASRGRTAAGGTLSPQQIAARLVRDYPNDPDMRVSHETIYRSLFVQARGALRKELTAACARPHTTASPQADRPLGYRPASKHGHDQRTPARRTTAQSQATGKVT